MGVLAILATLHLTPRRIHEEEPGYWVPGIVDTLGTGDAGCCHGKLCCPFHKVGEKLNVCIKSEEMIVSALCQPRLQRKAR